MQFQFIAPFFPILPIVALLIIVILIISVERNGFLTAFIWLFIGLLLYLIRYKKIKNLDKFRMNE